ncbi:hypothetical protein, partial [Ruthenibacterium lactatiformans]|uniref:hypothetical protein n=1 Tax=Ruthenibacterium lactatiformans TaxID=1550024 RepID=UPI003AB97002
MLLYEMPRAVLRGACLQYTMAPRSGLDKTAFTAVLHGSMFSSPVRESASAHEERAAAQAADLRLLYHDAAKRPRQNRIHCGFAWFNVLKSMRESASAHEERAAAQAAGLRLLYHDAAKRPRQNRIHCGFAWFNVLKPCARKRTSARRARGRASGGLEVIIPYFRLYVMLSVHICQ